METYVHLWKHLAEFFSELEMFQTKVVVKIKIYTLFSILFCENRAFYKIWENAEPERPQMTIRCMRSACCITKATNILPKYVIVIAFPQQQRLLEIASVLSKRHTVYLVSLQIEAKNTPRN
jgi:hypothetical protein